MQHMIDRPRHERVQHDGHLAQLAGRRDPAGSLDFMFGAMDRIIGKITDLARAPLPGG